MSFLSRPLRLIPALALALGFLPSGAAWAQSEPGIEFLPDSLARDTVISESGTSRIRIGEDKDERTIEISIGGKSHSSTGVVRFFEDIVIDEDEFVDGDVVAMGGDITNLGHVSGDVVSMGGDVTIGESAVVEGDVVSLGGTTEIRDGADVRGDAVGVWGSLDVSPDARVSGDEVQVGGIGAGVVDGWPRVRMGHGWSGLFSFWSLFRHVVWLVVLAGLAMLLFQIFPSRMEGVAATVQASGIRTFLAGLAGEALWLPLIGALTITLVGIPVVVLVVFLTPIALLVGYAGVMATAGKRMAGRRGSPWGRNRSIFFGLLAIEGVLLLSHLLGVLGPVFQVPSVVLRLIGVLVIWVAITMGFGAIILSRFRRGATLHRGGGSPSPETPPAATPGTAGSAFGGAAGPPSVS